MNFATVFAFYLTNDAQWLVIHVKELMDLQVMHPGVYEEFNK